MPTSIPLPLASESIRCVDFAMSNNVDPGGTALHPEILVVVELPEPWPKPVGRHELLVDLVAAVFDRPENIRLLAAVPHGPAPRVISFRPSVTGMMRSEQPLGDDSLAALEAVLDVPGTDVDTATGDRTILVCTQGSHDMCCGVDGERLATELEKTRPDLELFRVSHTGGHRFAPTAMTLPDGRMWAYLTTELADGIIDRTATDTAPQCRGWWGAPTGRAQMAERAVFEQLGFVADQLERTVTVGVGEDPNLVDVVAGDRRWLVRVEPGRDVPTISCEMPGGEPVKPGREWDVISIVEQPT